MTPERWAQVDQLLDAVLERTPSERAAFLHTACADDEQLRVEVETLLAAHEQAGSFINTVAAGEAARLVIDRSREPEPAARLLGRTLGRYEIVELLGAGGMGEVYRARDRRLDRQVAVKVLPPHLAAHPDAMARFAREAKAVAALSHPNILAIHDFGTEANLIYAVMELLEGETLRARVQRGRLTWRDAAKIGARVATGLSAAHARGIIHRDIKPENIFLTADGQTKILDFGIARVRRLAASTAATQVTETDPTTPGTLLGTIGYMSPEQVRGETAEATSDIFSLGCVLAEMVTGRRLFVGSSAAETMAAILRDEPPTLGGAQELPFEFERIVHRCLMKDPDERFQSARDLALDLRQLQTANHASTPALALTKPAAPRYHKWMLGAASLLLLLLLVLTGWWWFKRAPTAQPLDSLAVLPLVNVSGDPEFDYLSDGVSESVIGNLAPLRPKLRVAARGAVIGYKGKEVDPRQVGRDLNVRAVLTGRVLKQGEGFIIRAELADARDGTQLWSEQYQGNRRDLLAVQEKIARQISERLRPDLTGAEQRLLDKSYTQDPEAYSLYLNGRYFWNQRSEEGYRKAIEYFNQAIARDPNYALAYAGLADVYILQANLKAEEAATKALQLDPTLAEPHATLGMTRMYTDWNWPQAEAKFKQAIQLNPDYATAHHWYAELLTTQGRFDEALTEIGKARALDPRSFPINKDAGVFLFFARRYDEAIRQLQRTIEADPKHDEVRDAQGRIGNCYEQLGRFDQALTEFLSWLSRDPNIDALRRAATSGIDSYRRQRIELLSRQTPLDGRVSFRIAMLHAQLGEKDEAFAWLQQAYEKHSPGMIYLRVEPRFDPLRSDPRFQEWLRRMKLD